MPKKVSHVHKDVAAVAQAAAAELYETLMGDNLMFEVWKRKHPGAGPKGLLQAFVDENWAKCIPFARATMARILANPTIDEATKERIMDALELDDTLRLGRENPSIQLN